MAVTEFKRREAFPADSLHQIRDLWMCLQEIQAALEQDETRLQDRANRFAWTLGLLADQLDGSVARIEKWAQVSK